MTTDGRLGAIVGAWEQLAGRRYPVVLILYDRRTDLPADFFAEGARRTNVRFLDLTDEVVQGRLDAVAGAFAPHHMLDWLRDTARTHGGFWLDSADSLVTTWGERERRGFFNEFLRQEPRGPAGRPAAIVLGSALAGQLELHTESTGQGMVFRL